MDWQTKRIGPDFDHRSPDGSEIRMLVQVRGGSMVYCTLQPGQVTRPVQHRSVEEVWLCVAARANCGAETPPLKQRTSSTLKRG